MEASGKPRYGPRLSGPDRTCDEQRPGLALKEFFQIDQGVFHVG